MAPSLKKKKHSLRAGFTLIELLVVISIVGMLASVIMASLNNARAKARDAKRLADMKQLVTALALYYDQNGQYPDSDFAGCGGWDSPGNGTFIHPLVTGGFIASDPKDPKTNDDCGNYAYYRYPAGSYSCNSGRGAYFVIGARDLEAVNGSHPNSPGWRCPDRDWQTEFEWVTGSFER